MDTLYYPHLNLPASAWVNPILLYFDRIGIITPEGDHPQLFEQRTHELFDSELAFGVRPQVNQWSNKDNDRFVSYIIGRASNARDLHPFERVHLGKLSYISIANDLVEAGILQRVDDFWLEGPKWAVAHIMSYLALQLSAHASRPMPLITDERAAVQVVSGTRETRVVNRRIRTVTRLLPVPAAARPAEIARFRDNHGRELAEFRRYVDALITRNAFDDRGEVQLETRLREAERVRDYLLNEVQAFNWRQQIPTIAIAMAATTAPLLEHSPWSAGAGLLGLLMAGSQSLMAYRRRHAASQSPLVYSAQVAGRWKPESENSMY